jgi:hypothetical protein
MELARYDEIMFDGIKKKTELLCRRDDKKFKLPFNNSNCALSFKCVTLFGRNKVVYAMID